MDPVDTSFSEEKRSEERRKPRQKRAQATLGLMFDAAVEVISRHGITKLTMERVAQAAGLSVGSMYQYFENKQALLMALAEREFAGTSQAVLESVTAAMQVPGADLDEVAAQALVSSIGHNFRLRRELVLLASNAGRADMLQLPLMKVEAAFVAAGLIPASPNAQLRAFVLISAATGVLHAALQRDGQWLGDSDLPKEIARLTRAYRMAT
jgi:AcrR family transcriptional regulator